MLVILKRLCYSGRGGVVLLKQLEEGVLLLQEKHKYKLEQSDWHQEQSDQRWACKAANASTYHANAILVCFSQSQRGGTDDSAIYPPTIFCVLRPQAWDSSKLNQFWGLQVSWFVPGREITNLPLTKNSRPEPWTTHRICLGCLTN